MGVVRTVLGISVFFLLLAVTVYQVIIMWLILKGLISRYAGNSINHDGTEWRLSLCHSAFSY